MATQPKHEYSFTEYLEFEELSETKHEFYAGEILAMAGGTVAHSELSVRMAILLARSFPSCRIVGSDLKLYIAQADHCVYPDCMVLCEQPQFSLGRSDVVVNPTVVVEVLSPSTERYDRDRKTVHYMNLPSLEHILLVSQHQVSVEHHARLTNNEWARTQYGEVSDVIPISGAAIPLCDLYRGILSDD